MPFTSVSLSQLVSTYSHSHLSLEGGTEEAKKPGARVSGARSPAAPSPPTNPPRLSQAQPGCRGGWRAPLPLSLTHAPLPVRRHLCGVTQEPRLIFLVHGDHPAHVLVLYQLPRQNGAQKGPTRRGRLSPAPSPAADRPPARLPRHGSPCASCPAAAAHPAAPWGRCGGTSRGAPGPALSRGTRCTAASGRRAPGPGRPPATRRPPSRPTRPGAAATCPRPGSRSAAARAPRATGTRAASLPPPRMKATRSARAPGAPRRRARRPGARRESPGPLGPAAWLGRRGRRPGGGTRDSPAGKWDPAVGGRVRGPRPATLRRVKPGRLPVAGGLPPEGGGWDPR